MKTAPAERAEVDKAELRGLAAELDPSKLPRKAMADDADSAQSEVIEQQSEILKQMDALEDMLKQGRDGA
jgi:hypothetical protein